MSRKNTLTSKELEKINEFKEYLLNKYELINDSKNCNSIKIINYKKSNNNVIIEPKTKSKSGYLQLRITFINDNIYYNGTYYFHRLKFYLYNKFFPEEIDHVDRNKLNNSLSNLIASNHHLNNKNKSNKSTEASQYIGVTKNRNKWLVSINLSKNQKDIYDKMKNDGFAGNNNGRFILTKRFSLEEEAAAAIFFNETVIKYGLNKPLNIINYDK